MGGTSRQPARARVRARYAAVVAVLACTLLFPLAVLPAAAGSSDAGAQATVAVGAGDQYRAVAVSAATADNTATTETGGTLPAGVDSLGTGTATCSSFVVDRTLTSAASATATGVSLLGGVVTADSVHVSATASVLDGNAQASTNGSAVSGLHVAGVADADVPSQGNVDVPGVGTLTILNGRSEGSGGSASAGIDGLELTLSTATDGLPAQTTIIVGSLVVSADQATLDALLGTPTPTPSVTPSHTPTPRPTKTRTSTPRPTPIATLPATTLLPGATGSTYPSTAYSAMPTPPTPSPEILARFPGAVFPVIGTYTYTDTFGAYRADMPNKQHEGDDIFATYGSPVVAVQNGTITGMSLTTIGGNNIHLTTSTGDYFYYAHLSRFATGLAQGQQVVAGQTIGYVGDTGDARGTPPHLHFEIHPDGGPAIDPTPYLDAWRAAGHQVATGQTSQQLTTTAPTPSSTPDDPAMDAAVQQAADGFAALQADITSGSRHVPGRGTPLGVAGAVLVVVNTAGALLIKRLQLGAVLLP